MPEIKRIEIRCMSCKTWLPSPIHLGSSETFNTSTLIGNTVRCPSCGTMTACNKENMRWTRSDGKGGFVGIDTTIQG